MIRIRRGPVVRTRMRVAIALLAIVVLVATVGPSASQLFPPVADPISEAIAKSPKQITGSAADVPDQPTQDTPQNPAINRALPKSEQSYAGMELDAVSDGASRFGRGPDGSLISLAQGNGARLALSDRHGDVVGGFPSACCCSWCCGEGGEEESDRGVEAGVQGHGFGIVVSVDAAVRHF
ncbi:hypothetical protein JOF56_001533 [Kibdelosporangium banguiense]|uniref:Secreted protein n=1 Tax=Kibdelosporangium banguiense TaxID=1365924 RepID=A0ABS4T9R9_9PSEU|nr:hypothetical protein [Kibdelosporangium banguiense]MBP2321148.1 hypothetical protein [Kibdelosporangium banguiense]